MAVTNVANGRRRAAALPVAGERIPPGSSGVTEFDVIRRALPVIGSYVALSAAASLVGWAADLPRLTDWENDGISIQPNAAIAATAAGIALILHAIGHTRLSTACGVFVAAIGGATIFEYVSGIDLGIDTLLMFDRQWGRRGTIFPGRMGPPGSLSWTLIGTALILLGRGARCRRAAAVLGVVVVSIAALSVTGYLFGADRLYTIPTLTVIAFQTATMILGSGFGILLATREQGPMRLLLENSAAGVMLRRLLPLVITIPIVLGFFRVAGQNAGLYDTAMGTAMLVLVLIGLLCAVLWWGAGAVREHETRLLTSIRELEAVFRAAPVGIAVSRDSRCEHVEVNAAFAAMLGLREDSHAGFARDGAEDLSFRVTDEDGRAVAPTDLPLQVAARTGEPVTRTLIVKPADEARIVSAIAVPVQQAAGTERGAIAVLLDVSAERRSLAEREKLLAVAQAARFEAESANRAKDDFLALVSHELRSPLNAMLGWLQIMKRPGADEHLIGRAVETIERNTRAQTQIINDLLDISRIQSGKFELEQGRVDLTAVVVASIESLRPLAQGKALELELSLPEEPVYVDGDSGRLQQVITNVAHNAIKFTPERARISVTMTRHGDQVSIRVEDAGQGIEPALLPHIFDRFVQADSATTRRHGGLGLGLAIVKQLVERHGGSVSAQSDGTGHGSVFTLTFPMARYRKEAPPIPRVPSTATDSSIDTLDVLVVEDDDDSREALRMTLERAGARVRVARSVTDALAAYDDRRPDILVSDIGMPVEDGYTLIRRIRDREEGGSRRTLAIALTGFASRYDHETALRAGFDDHLGKPVEPAALVQCVRVLSAARSART